MKKRTSGLDKRDNNKRLHAQKSRHESTDKSLLEDGDAGHFSDYADVYEDDNAGAVRGEIALWKSVIMQALQDAGSNSTKREMRLVKQQATSWLLGMSDDFVDVCMRADMDPSYVRRRAKEAMDRNCQWRKHNPNSYQRPKRDKGKNNQRSIKETLRDIPLETKSDNVVMLRQVMGA